MRTRIICLTVIGVLAVLSGSSVWADPDPTFLAHFNGTDPNDHLGEGFYRSADPGEFWPAGAAVVDSSVLTYIANGKFGGAIEVDGTPAYWPVAGHLGADVGDKYTVEFWWKPNFPRPTTDTVYRIWEWRSEYDTDRFYLYYRYRQAQNDEYLLFRVPTSSTGGIGTNTTTGILPIDFNDFNYVGIRWENISGTDHTGVKINDRNPTYKSLTSSIDNPAAGSFFELKYGIFDELRIVNDFLSPTDMEANRVLGREYEPDAIPDNCDQVQMLDYEMKAGDLDGNCRVDLEDFALLVQDWGKCIHPDDAACDAPWN